MTLTIWHNPRCSKSRQTLALLQDHGHQPEIRLYLQDPPTETELADVLKLAELSVGGLIRKGEKRFVELGLNLSDDGAVLIRAMAENPVLIERPVVISGTRAALGRPPEAVLDIL